MKFIDNLIPVFLFLSLDTSIHPKCYCNSNLIGKQPHLENIPVGGNSNKS